MLYLVYSKFSFKNLNEKYSHLLGSWSSSYGHRAAQQYHCGALPEQWKGRYCHPGKRRTNKQVILQVDRLFFLHQVVPVIKAQVQTKVQNIPNREKINFQTEFRSSCSAQNF